MPRLLAVDYTGRVIVISGFHHYERMAMALSEASGRMSITALSKPFRIADLRRALTGQ
jgi:hypothetical protein